MGDGGSCYYCKVGCHSCFPESPRHVSLFLHLLPCAPGTVQATCRSPRPKAPPPTLQPGSFCIGMASIGSETPVRCNAASKPGAISSAAGEAPLTFGASPFTITHSLANFPAAKATELATDACKGLGSRRSRCFHCEAFPPGKCLIFLPPDGPCLGQKHVWDPWKDNSGAFFSFLSKLKPFASQLPWSFMTLTLRNSGDNFS